MTATEEERILYKRSEIYRKSWHEAQAKIDTVLTLHPVQPYRPHPGWGGLVDDPNDPDVVGCPACESDGPCETRTACMNLDTEVK